MKVAYIAGPYRAKNGSTIVENIRRAEKVAMKYWRQGYAVICPHMNSAFFDGVAPDKTFLDGDLEFVKRSDIIIMMTNYKDSQGACEELTVARGLQKEVIFE